MGNNSLVTRQKSKAHIWSLVLQAVNIEHSLEFKENNWFILTRTEENEIAKAEIESYEEENLNWPEIITKQTITDKEPLTLFLLGSLACFFMVTGPWKKSIFFSSGSLTNEVFRSHEWWRPLTALTLHGDVAHLVGNITIGGIIIHQLLKITGTGCGIFFIFLSGFLGNLVNLYFHPDPYQSVGFSTSVFGAIGILVGMQLNRGTIKMFIPLGGGLALLGLLGTSGEHTDLGAHFFGFSTGLLLGIPLSFNYFFQFITKKLFQRFFLFGMILLIYYSWEKALG
jgi:rhomboid protease GluP